MDGGRSQRKHLNLFAGGGLGKSWSRTGSVGEGRDIKEEEKRSRKEDQTVGGKWMREEETQSGCRENKGGGVNLWKGGKR